jgi:hypothetical protein
VRAFPPAYSWKKWDGGADSRRREQHLGLTHDSALRISRWGGRGTAVDDRTRGRGMGRETRLDSSRRDASIVPRSSHRGVCAHRARDRRADRRQAAEDTQPHNPGSVRRASRGRRARRSGAHGRSGSTSRGRRAHWGVRSGGGHTRWLSGPDRAGARARHAGLRGRAGRRRRGDRRGVPAGVPGKSVRSPARLSGSLDAHS